jgi:hypothetical protein
LIHQAKLHRKPEEAGHRLDDAREPAKLLVLVRNACDEVCRRMRAIAEANQSIREGAVSVHRHMPRDIVKDVGFGKIIEQVPAPNRDRGGKFTVP